MSDAIGKVLNVVVWLSIAGLSAVACPPGFNVVVPVLCVIAMILGMIYYQNRQ